MRQHIFLGFAAILILFTGIGVCAFWLFSGVGSALDVIVGDGQQRILAAKAMKESAERMDSTLSSALTGGEEGRKNEVNVTQLARQARNVSAHAARTMFVVWVVGVGVVLSGYFATQQAIFKPLQSLTAVAKELGNGNLDQVVPVQSKDEIGALATAFNKLSAKLRAYRQITADQILQARQMTEITFSAFPDAILALSVDGRIDFANPAAEELLRGLDSQVGLPPRIREEAEHVLNGATDYMPTSFEKAVPVLINEHEAYLLPRVIGMRDESGKLFGAAIVLQDVTRFRLMDEVKTNLVSTVSHELKTPLSSIRMGLHLLLEERIGALNPKQLELLLAAREDSERLLRMINDLLDLARLESGQTRQRFEIISPGTSGKGSEFYFDFPAINKGAKT